MFSEQERKEFIEDGLSNEEIDLLESTLALSETIKMIPDDIDAFLEEIKAKIPDDTINGMKAIAFSAEKDPEFFKKLIALDIAMEYDASLSQEKSKSQDAILDNLTSEEYKTATKNYFKTIQNLGGADREQFLKLIINLTSEQKADMIERLKA